MFNKLTLAMAASAASVAFAPAASANLIVNGDFSAPACAGWVVASNAFGCDSAYREGNVGGEGSISQTFAATVGSLLTVTFDYGGDAGYQYVRFNGVNVAGSFVSNPSSVVNYAFNLGPAQAANTLSFIGRNDPSFNYLDNVVVTAAGVVPEPATWALLILGMGTIGMSMRRRRTMIRIAYA